MGDVFNASVTFGGGARRHGAETVTGVAFYDAAINRLYSAALELGSPSHHYALGDRA